MKKTKFKLSNAFYNNHFVFVFSLVCALLVWLVVTLQVSDEREKIITGVPVVIDYEAVKDKYDLEPFGTREFTVNVTVRGMRYVVENSELKNDIIATASTGLVTSAGTKKLSVEVNSSSLRADYQIVDVSLDEIEVYFDVMAEKEFEIGIDIGGEFKDNIAPEGYFVQTPSMDADSVVKVSGPKTQINNATAVTAFVSIDEQITDTEVFAADVKIVTAGESSYLRTDLVSNTINVTLPVYKVVNMPASVGFTNKPAKYINSIPFEISIQPSAASFAIRESKLVGLDSVEILTIDFSTLRAGKNTFTVTKDGEEFKDMLLVDENTVFTVTVTIPDVTASNHTVTIGPSSFINVPNGVSATLVTQSIPVMVIGPQASLDAVENGNFAVSIDLSGVDPTVTTQSVPIEIYLIDSQDCWIYGEYVAEIAVTDARQ